HCRQARAPVMTPLLSGPQQPIGVAQHRLTKMRRRIRALALRSEREHRAELGRKSKRYVNSSGVSRRPGTAMVEQHDERLLPPCLRVIREPGSAECDGKLRGASGCGQIERGERAGPLASATPSRVNDQRARPWMGITISGNFGSSVATQIEPKRVPRASRSGESATSMRKVALESRGAV